MKLVDLKKKYEGKYLTYYVASYLNKNNEIKEYEFISRNNNLDINSFGAINPQGVGMIAFNMKKDKILLQKEFRLACNNYVYNFPAGLIDFGEDASVAAKRELKEETGVNLIQIDKVLSPSYASQGTSDEMMQIVICRCEGEIVNSSFVDEEIEASWYTKEEIKKLLNDNVYMSVRTQMFLWQWINE